MTRIIDRSRDRVASRSIKSSMTMKHFFEARRYGTALSVAALLLAGTALSRQVASAQLSYSSGQPVSPAFEGWDQNPDGSFNMIFGYMNQNWEEEIDVPVGPDNNISPGGPDQGQPTHLYPRRNRFVFKVRVPRDFGNKELVWTLNAHGRVLKAYATLKQDFFTDNMVMASETGALGPGVSSPEVRANQPPTIEAVGDTMRTVKAGQPITLYAQVKDDGVPKSRQRQDLADPRRPVPDLRMIPPRQITVGSSTGLWASLLKYRGPGNVSYEQDQIKAWEDTRAGANSQWAPRWVAPPPPPDGKWSATVTFDEPGDYVMRWHASDGALTVDQDIKVKVTK
jgi:hypothetical protein